ncbi:MAG: hypothetical protein KIT16_02215 [Rhodospirillaceae bacterium]|nr:hypothetical protein [Rhodospirillaceae bacterium]
MVGSVRNWLGLKAIPALGVCAAALMAASGPAWAQTNPDIKRETDAPVRTTESVLRSNETESDAARARSLEGRKVTYDEVLRDPDNVDLNYAFALTQIREGDLLGALSTIERILLKNPALPRVRLLHAVVLYRLNATAEAEREIDTVLKFDMDPGLRRELEYYRSRVARDRQKTKFTAIVRTGWHWDSNRNAAPITRGIISAGGAATKPEAIDSHSLENLVRLEAEHDLGFQRRHRLIGSVTGLHDLSLKSNRFTLTAVDVRGGIALDLAPDTLTIQPHYRYARLDDDSVFQAWGGSFRLDLPTKRNLFYFVQASGEYQVFNATASAPSSNLRSGPEWRLAAGARYSITPEHRLTLTLTGIRKVAREEFFQYSGFQTGIEHGWLLGRGMYLLSNLSWEGDWYDGADPNVNATVRKDDLVRFRAIFGVPFATLTGWSTAPRPLRDIGISIGFEYTRAFSNVDNYRYQNFRVMGALTKRFDF